MICFVSLSSMNQKLWKLSQMLKSAVLCDAHNDASKLKCVGASGTV